MCVQPFKVKLMVDTEISKLSIYQYKESLKDTDIIDMRFYSPLLHVWNWNGVKASNVNSFSWSWSCVFSHFCTRYIFLTLWGSTVPDFTACMSFVPYKNSFFDFPKSYFVLDYFLVPTGSIIISMFNYYLYLISIEH